MYYDEFYVSTGFLSIIGIIIGIFVILLASIFFVICTALIFRKCGEKWWKAIIPVYNIYIFFKLVWNAKNFLFCLIPGIVIAIATVVQNAVAFAMPNVVYAGLPVSPLYIIVPIAALFISFAATIVQLVWLIRLYYRLSKSFGYGVGFTIGLTIIPIVFYAILAFNRRCFMDPNNGGEVYDPQNAIDVVEEKPKESDKTMVSETHFENPLLNNNSSVPAEPVYIEEPPVHIGETAGENAAVPHNIVIDEINLEGLVDTKDTVTIIEDED